MEPIHFTSQLSLHEYVKASFYTTYRRPVMVFFTLVGAFMLVTSLLFYAGLGWQFGRMPLVQLFLGLYFLVLLPVLIYVKCKSNFNAKNRFTERMEWVVDDEWFAMKGETFESKMTWDKVHQVVETKEVFLIYQSKILAHILSKREMSREQVQGFRGVVSGVLGMKKKLRTD